MNKPAMPSTWPGLMPPEDRTDYEARHEWVNFLANAHADAIIEDQWRTPANLLNPNWKYTPSSETDVRKTWARFGWKPTK